MSGSNGNNGNGATVRTPSKRRGTSAANWQERFLEGLAATFNVEYACKIARVSKDKAYYMRRNDDGFRRKWDEAREVGIDQFRAELEECAINLATKGSKKKVYFQGQVCGEETIQYPGLIMFLLERLIRARYFVRPNDVPSPDAQLFAANVYALIEGARKTVKAPEEKVVDAEVAA